MYKNTTINNKNNIKEELIFTILSYSDEDLAMLVGRYGNFITTLEAINALRYSLFMSATKYSKPSNKFSWIKDHINKILMIQ